MGENQTHKNQNSILVSLAHGGNVGKVGAKQRRLVNDGNGVTDETVLRAQQRKPDGIWIA